MHNNHNIANLFWCGKGDDLLILNWIILCNEFLKSGEGLCDIDFDWSKKNMLCLFIG